MSTSTLSIKEKRPVRHDDLRAFLQLARTLWERKDVELLKLLSLQVDNLEAKFQIVPALGVYIYQLTLELQRPELDYLYNDAELNEARLTVEREAYGDIVEALFDLESDLRGGRIGVDFKSDVYKDEFFETEDRAIWEKGRQALQTTSEKEFDARWAAAGEIRKYLQKYLGPFETVRYYGYINSDGSHGYGVTVRVGQPVPARKKGYALQVESEAKLFSCEIDMMC